MARQRSIEERMAEAQAKRQKLDDKLKQLEQRQRAIDTRRRFKGEKVILQLVLGRALRDDEFKADLVAELAAASLKPEDRDAALWVLTGAKNEIDAKPGFLAEDAVSEPEHPQQHVA